MDISFLIPTIRPHEQFLNIVLSNIRSIPTKYSYEICVYGPEKPKDENVVWFEEKERTGQLYGFNLMAKHCNGEYLVVMVDDHVLQSPIDESIDFLKSDFFKNRKYKITSLNPGDIVCNPVRGQIMGDQPIDFDIPRFPICRFPIMDKNTFHLLGDIIFNPCLRSHAGDNFLGGYMFKKGEICVDGPTRIIAHNPQKFSQDEVRDCNIVRKLWKKLYENPDLPYNYILNE